MKRKTWEQIEKEVENEMLERFNSVPLEHRAKLGLEPGSHSKSHENRQWVQTYIQMLTWKNKCRELHGQLNPVKLVKNPAKKENKNDK